MNSVHGFSERAPPPAGYDESEPAELPNTNVEAEASLLGALMLHNDLVPEIMRLRPEHFYEPLHADIYKAVQDRVEAGKIANPITLKPMFVNHQSMSEVGGLQYLAQLTGSGASVVGARDFANQIVELAERRATVKKLEEALATARDGSNGLTAAEIIGGLESELGDCLVNAANDDSTDMGDAAADAVKIIEQTAEGKPPAGFAINLFDDYNHVRGRMEPGDFDLLAGRPGMGKTAVSLAIGLGAADAGVGVEYLSLEMRRDKMVRRVLANMIYRPGLSCTYEQLIAGRLGKDDWRALAEAQERLATLPFGISDPKGGMMIEDLAPFLRKRAKRMEKKGHKLGLVIIDYLGRFGSRRKFNSTAEFTAHVSATIKNVASELGVCIITLAQLNRAVEQRENKRPMLADLRDSGSLEQDADNVIFLYRDEYYLEKTEPPRDKEQKWQAWADELNEVRDSLEIYSSKRREGGLTKRVAKFFARFQAVRDHGDYAAAPDFFDDDKEFRL